MHFQVQGLFQRRVKPGNSTIKNVQHQRTCNIAAEKCCFTSNFFVLPDWTPQFSSLPEQNRMFADNILACIDAGMSTSTLSFKNNQDSDSLPAYNMVNIPGHKNLLTPMKCRTYSTLSLVVLLGATATSLVPAPTTAAEAAPAAQPPRLTQTLTNPQALPPSFLPSITVSALMKDTINPNVRALWNAVSYTVTEQGVTDTKPATQADWDALHVNADTLLKAAGTLILPALKLEDDPQQKTPDYQYSAAEIQTLRQQNPEGWREYAQRLQATTRQLIIDIEKQDVEAYTEHGSPINQACEGCHAEFWYRPPPRRAR